MWDVEGSKAVATTTTAGFLELACFKELIKLRLCSLYMELVASVHGERWEPESAR